MKKPLTFEESLNEFMKDPEFRAEWEDLAPAFQIVEAIIKGRSINNFTEEQLVEATGISLAYIRRLENGTANPSLRTLKRLAAGMGMRVKLEFIPLARSE